MESELDKNSETFPAGGTPQPQRDERDILEEILSLVRTIAKEHPLLSYASAMTPGIVKVSGEVGEGSDNVYFFPETPLGNYTWSGTPSASGMLILGQKVYRKKKDEPPSGEEEK